MSAATMPLAQWQARLQATLLDGAAPPAVAARDAADARRRVQVYAEAYRLRLGEALGKDYPTLQALLGAPAFAALCAGYIAAHPSDRPSLRDFGRHLPAWLRRAHRRTPAWAELAAFEWAQGEVFDAADGDPALLADLAGCTPAQWPRLPLRLLPAVRLLRLRGNAAAQALAQAQGLALPAPQRAAAARDWLVWRAGHEIRWRALESDEAAALRRLLRGCRFGALCTRLAAVTPHEDVALRAASLLKRWIADGLLQRFAEPPLPSPT